MTLHELEKLFSEKVAKYINEGYVFYSPAMNVSYSAYDGCVTLYKGTTIVRIAFIHSRNNLYDKIINLTTFTITLPKIDKWFRDSDMQIVEQLVFYALSDTYMVTAKEYIELNKEREEKIKYRASNYYNSNYKRISFDDRTKKIVLSYIQRKPRCKSVKLSEIKEVFKDVREDRHNKEIEVEYLVIVRGKPHAYSIKRTVTKKH